MVAKVEPRQEVERRLFHGALSAQELDDVLKIG